MLGAGPGTLLRSPGPPPYLRRWGAGDRARALPFVVVVTRGAPAPGPTGRYRARPGHVGHVPAPFFCCPAPLGAFLRSCGAVGP